MFDVDTAANNQVTYTVEDAVVGASHRVALFDADDLTVDGEGVVTFADQDGDIAAQTAVESEIIAINDDADATGNLESQLTDGFVPTSGSFTFTVETQTGELENVVPVVFFDDPDDLQNGVVVDEDGVPDEDALFGVGGAIEALPQELGSGGLGGDRDIVFVDKDRNIIVIDSDGNGVLRHLIYSDADTFYIGGTTDDDEVDLAGFEARLATGDELADPGTTYSRTAASQFELNDISPPAVEDVSADTVSDELGAINVTWDDTNTEAASEYNVYRAEGDFADAVDRDSDTEDEFELVDTVSASADLEVEDRGLDDDTEYTYWVTAVIDGVEGLFDDTAAGDSAFDNATTLEADELTAPTITSASLETDANLQNVFDEDDVWTIVFDKQMRDFTTDGEFVVSNGQSQVTISCAAAAAADTAECDLDNAPDDGPEDSVLTMTFSAADAAPSFAEGTNAYPLTIVTTNAAVADTFDNPVSIANSDDVTIE